MWFSDPDCSQEKLFVQRDPTGVPLFFIHFWQYSEDLSCWHIASNLMPLLEKADPSILPTNIVIGSTLESLDTYIRYLQKVIPTIDLIDDYFLDPAETIKYGNNLELCTIEQLWQLRGPLDSEPQLYIPYTIYHNKFAFIQARSDIHYKGVDCFYSEVEFDELKKHLITPELQNAFAEIYQQGMVFLYLSDEELKGYAAFDKKGLLQFFVITDLENI